MNIRQIVEQKGIHVRFERLSGNLRGSMFRKDNEWYILVNEEDPPERQNFTIAHEYAEILLNDEPGILLDEKHRQANRMAAELLLPEDVFRNSLCEKDLHALKNNFPDVSYEVIARRMTHFLPVVITIFDNGSLTARTGPDTINYPRAVSAEETEVVRQCYETGKTVRVENPPLCICGYYLEETNGIRRVILITEVDDCGM
ncbi:ImmA/IrrE family metallo-endopeptidase [candidate division KSB1 bacterium]